MCQPATTTLPNLFATHLKAEALRHLEEAAGAPERDPEIEARAIAAAPDLAGRIYARAELLSARLRLEPALDHAGRGLRVAVVLLLALGFALGLGSAHALPGGIPAQTNVVTLLLALLLPHALALLMWAGVTLLSTVAGSDTRLVPGWIGRRALGIQQFLARRHDADPIARAAARAWWEVLTSTAAGRHRLACASHGFWLAMLSGALLGCWWLLVVRQVDFFWGSTLLGTADMQSILGALSRAVTAFGLPVPSAADIAASRIDAPIGDPELRRRWGLFVLGAIAILGVLPRLVATMFDTTVGWCRGYGLRPDPRCAGYARLRPILLRLELRHEVLDPDTAAPPARDTSAPPDPVSGSGVPRGAAWFALDRKPDVPLDPSGSGIELGVIATRADRERALAQVAGDEEWPAICLAADLATTPDRGIARLLGELRARARAPLHLVLVPSARTVALPDPDRATRRDDWLMLARDCGLPPERVHLFDVATTTTAETRAS